MFDFIHSLPDSTPNFIAIFMFFMIVYFSWSLSKDYIFKGREDRSTKYDLRIWASLLLLMQSLLYLVF